MTHLYHCLPKAELHCHLDGSLSLPAIRQLADWAHIQLPESDEALKELVTAPASVTDLNDYLRTFDTVLPLLQTKEALRLAAFDVAEQAARENVLYIEIRFAPVLSTRGGLTVVEVVDSVLEGLQLAETHYPITARAIVCGMRHMPQTEIYSLFEEVVHLAPKGLVGFDFAGNEADFPTHLFAETVQQAQVLGVPFTFHAGECNCVQNIAEGLDLGIRRFGHATALYQSSEALQRFVDLGATAEMCLTSNLQTKAAPSLADFPYLALYQAGGNITINTDNRTVSDTNLTKEYQLLHHYFGTSVQDFLTFNEQAIRASFVADTVKEELLAALRQGYAPYLDETKK